MRVVVITHGYPPLASGGSQLYAHAQAVALARSGDAVLVVTRDCDPGRPERAVRRERCDGVDVVWINNTFADARSFADAYRDDRLDAVAGPIIAAFQPQVAHVHHLTCLSTTIVNGLAARGVPVFVTLHDYWLICHRGQLLDTRARPCAGPEPAGCARCLGSAGTAADSVFALRPALAAAERRLPAAIAKPLRRVAARAAGALSGADSSQRASATRTSHMRGVLAHVTHFLAPSRAVRDRFVAFGVPAGRITVSEYGWDLPLPGPADDDRASALSAGPLRLGFLGSLMVSKAPHVLIEAAGRLPEGSVCVEVFGEATDYHGDDSYRAVLAPLLRRPYVRRHGQVDRARIRSALRGIDVLVVPSVWPEVSPLVIREAFLAGVPVVASRIGGIPETVVDGVNGLLFAPGDGDALHLVLARLAGEPDLLTRLRAGIPAVRAVADDVASLRALYARHLSRAAVPPATAAPSALAAVVLNFGTPDDTYLAVRSLLCSRRPIDYLIVVDNDEAPGPCEMALASFGHRVKYLPLGANLGYSGGMNAGIRLALGLGADHVLLVNSDVVVSVDAVGALERALERVPTAGIAGPTVLMRHAPDRIATAGIGYHRPTGRMRHYLAGRRLVDHRDRAVDAVAAVSGCCMLVGRAVFDTAGLLDDAYFFGFEDLDLCLRAHDAGLSTIVVPGARVHHEGGRSLGADSPARFYYAARNHLRLAARTARGARASRLARAALVVALNVAHAVRSSGGSTWARVAATSRGTLDHLRGRYGRAPADLTLPR